MKEIHIALQPKQKLFRESINQVPTTLFGGARGGGKSYALRNIFLLRRFEFPNSHAAIFRRTFPELEANHIRPLFGQFPELRPYYNEQKKLLTLPNGSSIQFCHCENEKDVALYQGREWQDLGIDEAGHFPESTFRTLQGSNRSSIPGVPARCALTANPGGIGHTWLKRVFIDKRFNERERAEDYSFVQSLVFDNPALIDNDPDYVHRLRAEPNEALRKAYLDGDWSIMAGQFFSELRKEVHLIKPFPIPAHWNRFGSYDFGFNHPAAFGWFAVDEDGDVYLYREIVKAQLRVDQFIQQIKKHDDTMQLSPIIGGLDCWAKRTNMIRGGSPPTIAELFSEENLPLSRAKVDRVLGANQLRTYLAWQGRPEGKPRFFIFDTCPITFDTLSRMQIDPDEPEDVLKQDAENGDPLSGDDAYDMVRYALMSRPLLTETPKIKHHPHSPEWMKQQIDEMEAVALKGIEPPEEEQWGDMEMQWE